MNNGRPPCAREVAEAALELEPESPVVAYLRAQPEVGGWMARLEATRRFDELLAAGVGSIEARRVVARRMMVHERTLRRWGLVGHLHEPLSNGS